MKKIVEVTLPEHVGHDLCVQHECMADATPDEMYQAVMVLYPEYVELAIVITRGDDNA